jgi:DNA-binding transcriptional regulator LsrR (DeoR family)
MNISTQEHHLWAKVAKLYYEEDLTQREIAKKLGFSRVKIHRILRSARDSGIVKISIKPPENVSLDLENKLLTKYDLRDCVIVQDYPPGEDLYRALNRGAASWLKDHLRPDSRIGLGLGRTLSHFPDVFEANGELGCTFTEIAGAVSDNSWGLNGNSIASRMAEICGGRAELFYAPTLVSNLALKEQLIQERSVKKALERARNCDIILQSVGPVDSSALLYIQGFITENDLEDLRAAGAVGDGLGCYYDIDGKIVPSPTEELMIGLHLTDLLETPWSVLIGGGSEKVDPIYGALKGKYFNVLITNQAAAEQLLAKDN